MPTQTFYDLKASKRDRIIDAALNEFAIHDYEHVNIQNIIKDAHISRGSFYQYFENLDDLFDYLLIYISTQKKAYLDHYQMLSSDEPFFDRIEKLYMRSYQFALEFNNFHLASKNMIDHAKAMKHPLFQQNHTWLHNYYQAEIQKDIDRGILDQNIDIDMVIHVLNLFLDELLTTHFIEKKLSESDVKHRFERFINLLKKGIASHV